MVPATPLAPKKGSMKACSTLSLTHFPNSTALITPNITPQNFFAPRDPIYNFWGDYTDHEMTQNGHKNKNDPPNDLGGEGNDEVFLWLAV